MKCTGDREDWLGLVDESLKDEEAYAEQKLSNASVPEAVVKIGRPVPLWYGTVMTCPWHVKTPWSRSELKPSCRCCVFSVRCHGHNSRMEQDGT